MVVVHVSVVNLVNILYQTANHITKYCKKIIFLIV
jgi:hypothetical protein